MTKQGWTATVSTALFVVLVALVSLVPVPFVSWSPGSATDLLGDRDGHPVLTVTGATTYPTTGSVQLTSVAVTQQEANMTLPQAFLAYLLPAQTVLQREVVYPIGRPATQQQASEVLQLQTSPHDAVVAALMAAGLPVKPLPLVTKVSSSGPAYGKVEAGDLITSVNGSVVERRSEVQTVLSQVMPGAVVRLGLLRQNSELEVTITAVAAQDDPTVAKLGIDWRTALQPAVQTEFDLDPSSWSARRTRLRRWRSTTHPVPDRWTWPRPASSRRPARWSGALRQGLRGAGVRGPDVRAGSCEQLLRCGRASTPR